VQFARAPRGEETEARTLPLLTCLFLRHSGNAKQAQVIAPFLLAIWL